MSSKTIDNLGIETSVRYALDQETYDKSMLSDSRSVSTQVSVEVNSPTYSPYLESFLGSSRQASWAAFYPPKRYNKQKKRLFSSSLIPSLGGEEFVDTQIQRVKHKHEHEKEKRSDAAELDWEEDKEQQEQDHESESLIELFEEIQALDKQLNQINARRTQFQKG